MSCRGQGANRQHPALVEFIQTWLSRPSRGSPRSFDWPAFLPVLKSALLSRLDPSASSSLVGSSDTNPFLPPVPPAFESDRVRSTHNVEDNLIV